MNVTKFNVIFCVNLPLKHSKWNETSLYKSETNAVHASYVDKETNAVERIYLLLFYKDVEHGSECIDTFSQYLCFFSSYAFFFTSAASSIYCSSFSALTSLPCTPLPSCMWSINKYITETHSVQNHYVLLLWRSNELFTTWSPSST